MTENKDYWQKNHIFISQTLVTHCDYPTKAAQSGISKKLKRSLHFECAFAFNRLPRAIDDYPFQRWDNKWNLKGFQESIINFPCSKILINRDIERNTYLRMQCHDDKSNCPIEDRPLSSHPDT